MCNNRMLLTDWSWYSRESALTRTTDGSSGSSSTCWAGQTSNSRSTSVTQLTPLTFHSSSSGGSGEPRVSLQSGEALWTYRTWLSGLADVPLDSEGSGLSNQSLGASETCESRAALRTHSTLASRLSLRPDVTWQCNDIRALASSSSSSSSS